MPYDLHTHILPGIDDGAATVEESLALLRSQVADGVGAVALTPHFRTDVMDLGDFVARRKEACKLLYSAAKEEKLPIGLNVGAEVMFSAALAEIDIKPLCYDGTKSILIELPTDHCPPYLREVLLGLAEKGYTPVIAHVERYPYFARSTDMLKTLADGGILMQANTASLMSGVSLMPRGETRGRVLQMLRDGLIHIAATDMHRAGSRVPALNRTLAVLKKKTGIDMTEKMRRLGL